MRIMYGATTECIEHVTASSSSKVPSVSLSSTLPLNEYDFVCTLLLIAENKLDALLPIIPVVILPFIFHTVKKREITSESLPRAPVIVPLLNATTATPVGVVNLFVWVLIAALNSSSSNTARSAAGFSLH